MRLPRDFAEKGVRGLDQDANAVTGLRVGADGAAVFKIVEYLQAVTDDVMAFDVFDVGDKSDTTGVMLVTRVVQTFFSGRPRCFRPR